MHTKHTLEAFQLNVFVPCALHLYRSVIVFPRPSPYFLLSNSSQGWGRWKNSEYLQFISILEETQSNRTPANKVRLWQELCVKIGFAASNKF